jgi:hypothetical protein
VPRPLNVDFSASYDENCEHSTPLSRYTCRVLDDTRRNNPRVECNSRQALILIVFRYCLATAEPDAGIVVNLSFELSPRAVHDLSHP